jgi:hypothetical protein
MPSIPASSRSGATNTAYHQRHPDLRLRQSINQYTAGKFDGVTVTNMTLTIPPPAASFERHHHDDFQRQ